MMNRITSSLSVAAALAGLAVTAGCAGGMSGTAMSGTGDSAMMDMSTSGPGMSLMPTPLATKAGLESATGMAHVDASKGMVSISVTLAPGTQLPAGSVLEGWLVSAGSKGGPGMSSASEADQKYGPAFGMPEVAMQSREIPYALSTGKLERQGNGNTYEGHFRIDNSLMPYGAVVVTLESDGNQGSYDPRPGTPVLQAMLK